MSWRRNYLALVLSALVLAGACGGDNKVGDESILNFEEQVNEGLGNTTTTTAPPAATETTVPGGGTATTAPAGGTKPTATTVTTARQSTTTTRALSTTTTAPQVQVLEIAIQGDSAESALEPLNAAAYLNTIIRWTNKDTVVRRVRGTNGEFVSPDIAPGKTFEWKATQVGHIDYEDPTRPYVANATLDIADAP